MAIIVLVQSILPCADATEVANKAKTTVSKAASQQLPQRDDCTPFCHCSCCASFAVVQFTAEVKAPVAVTNIQETVHIPSNIIQVTLPIWQPPRLV